MINENGKLLDKAINARLKAANDPDVDKETSEKSFKEAVEAIKIKNEIRKEIFEGIIKGLGIAVAIGVPVYEWRKRFEYSEFICGFEKDYTFTTSAGKGLSSIFRFK